MFEHGNPRKNENGPKRECFRETKNAEQVQITHIVAREIGKGTGTQSRSGSDEEDPANGEKQITPPKASAAPEVKDFEASLMNL